MINPSRGQRLARYGGESEDPPMWPGLVGAYLTSLGPTGEVLRNPITAPGPDGGRFNGALTDMDPATDWVVGNNPRLPGYVLDFDGSNDNVNLGRIWGTGGAGNFMRRFTISVWANLRATAGECLVGSWPGGSKNVLFDINSNNLRLFVRFSNTQEGSNFFSYTTTGQWDHFVATGDGSNLRVYLNGVASSTVTAYTGVVTFNIDTWIGWEGGTEFLDGQIGDVVLWRRAITARQVRSINNDPMKMFRREELPLGIVSAPAAGRIMSSLVSHGGLASHGGIAGPGGGLAG